MTIWDTIYKEKKKRSDTWATPSDRFHPLFDQFLQKSNFPIKHALDIGCGVGKYLKILQSKGFETDGIDSSETAVEMTKKLLKDDSNILCADMFEIDIPKNRYDLIIAILTIQHGTKDQIKNLVDKIYTALIENGNIFITLPDLKNSKKWNTFKNKQKIAEGTYIPLSGPEKGLPHSFFTKEEIQSLFSKFADLQLNIDDEGNWIIKASIERK
jgi:2-polyprenyl-3-methyl-5-hydroxy-6-metoxy-1,4-benzoquinol methylase